MEKALGMGNDGDGGLRFPADIRKTKQREDIFRILAEAQEPMSAADIYCLLCGGAGKEKYAVSTVYRVLGVFEEKGYVVRTSLAGSDMAYYEWCRGQHKHYAVCLKCHRLVPLKVCPLEHKGVHAGVEDFVITGHKLELYGYCKDCTGNSIKTLCLSVPNRKLP